MKFFISVLIFSFTFSSFASSDCKDIFQSTTDKTEVQKELSKAHEESAVDSLKGFFPQKLIKKLHDGRLTESEKQELVVELFGYLKYSEKEEVILNTTDFLLKILKDLKTRLDEIYYYTESEKKELVKEELKSLFNHINNNYPEGFTNAEKRKLVRELLGRIGIHDFVFIPFGTEEVLGTKEVILITTSLTALVAALWHVYTYPN